MALLAMTLGIGGYRLSNGLHILRARSLLSGRRMELMKFSRALEDFDDKSVCIGYGFTWLPEHTQKLHDLSRLNISTLILPSFMHRLFNRHEKSSAARRNRHAVSSRAGRVREDAAPSPQKL